MTVPMGLTPGPPIVPLKRAPNSGAKFSRIGPDACAFTRASNTALIMLALLPSASHAVRLVEFFKNRFNSAPSSEGFSSHLVLS